MPTLVLAVQPLKPLMQPKTKESLWLTMEVVPIAVAFWSWVVVPELCRYHRIQLPVGVRQGPSQVEPQIGRGLALRRFWFRRPPSVAHVTVEGFP